MEQHPAYSESLNHLLSLLTIGGIIVLVLWAFYLVKVMYQKRGDVFTEILARWVLPIGFFASFGGLLLTLWYSEVMHYVPCDLCWYQRVFLYPQVFMFGYAWWKKDRNILPYSLILSIAGFALAVYHHMLQIGYNIYKPCSTAPFAVDCAKPSFIEFGFVTFPLMAVVLFAFLGLLTTTVLMFGKSSK